MPMQTDDKSSHNHVPIVSTVFSKPPGASPASSTGGEVEACQSCSPQQICSNSTAVRTAGQAHLAPPHRALQVNFGSVQLFGITLRITETVRAMSTSNFTPGWQNDHPFCYTTLQQVPVPMPLQRTVEAAASSVSLSSYLQLSGWHINANRNVTSQQQTFRVTALWSAEFGWDQKQNRVLWSGFNVALENQVPQQFFPPLFLSDLWKVLIVMARCSTFPLVLTLGCPAQDAN